MQAASGEAPGKPRSNTMRSVQDDDLFFAGPEHNASISEVVMRRRQRTSAGGPDVRQSRIASIADELEKLQQSLGDANRRVAELTSQNDDLNIALKTKHDIIADLAAKNAQLQEVASGKLSARTAAAALDAAQAKLSKAKDKSKLDLSRSPSALSVRSVEPQHAAAGEAVVEVQAELTALRADFVSTISKLQDENKGLRDRLSSVLQERDESMEQLSSRKGTEHDLNTSRRSEDLRAAHDEPIAPETEQLRKTLATTAAELEAVRGQLAQTRQTKQFLEDALLGFEDESREQFERISALQLSAQDFDHRLGEKQAQIGTLEHQASQLATSLENARNGLNETKNELQVLRRERDEWRVVIEDFKKQKTDAVQHRDDALAEAERLNLWLENITKSFEALQTSSAAREQHLVAKAVDLQAELAVTKEKLKEGNQAIELELSASKSELHDQRQEMIQAKRELKEAQRTAADSQNAVDMLALQLQGEIALKQGQLDSVALAGLSLTELIENLRGEHARQLADLQRSADGDRQQLSLALVAKQHEHDETLGQLAERNALLTRVMDYIKDEDQRRSTSTQPNGDAAALVAQIDLATRSYDDRAQILEQLDQEAGALAGDVAFWRQRFHEQRLAKEALESRLQLKSSELEQLSNQQQGTPRAAAATLFSPRARVTESQTSEVFDASTVSGVATPSKSGVSAQDIEIANLKRELMLLNRQMEESRKQHMQALRDLGDERRQHEGHTHASVTAEPGMSLADELAFDTERSQREELARLRTDNERLSRELGACQAEMQGIRQELVNADLNLRLAAEAGLSLTQLINRMRDLHRDEVAKLQERLDAAILDERALRFKLMELLSWQPNAAALEENYDHSDIIASLKHRLQEALRRQIELEAILAEYSGQRSPGAPNLSAPGAVRLR